MRLQLVRSICIHVLSEKYLIILITININDFKTCFFYIGVMNTAGGIIHDQAEADTDASIQERIAIGVGQLNQMCLNV